MVGGKALKPDIALELAAKHSPGHPHWQRHDLRLPRTPIPLAVSRLYAGH